MIWCFWNHLSFIFLSVHWYGTIFKLLNMHSRHSNSQMIIPHAKPFWNRKSSTLGSMMQRTTELQANVKRPLGRNVSLEVIQDDPSSPMRLGKVEEITILLVIRSVQVFCRWKNSLWVTTIFTATAALGVGWFFVFFCVCVFFLVFKLHPVVLRCYSWLCA